MASSDERPAWGRTAELVKTYRAVNDPNAPAWSVRFVGGIAAFALLAAALAAVALASVDAPASSAALSSTVQERADGTRTDYVGFVPSPGAPVDAARLDDALAAWRAAHPDAEVLREEPVRVGGQLVGWHIMYRP